MTAMTSERVPGIKSESLTTFIGISMHRITEPTEEQKRLLHQLRITLPERLEIDLQCSVDSAIA